MQNPRRPLPGARPRKSAIGALVLVIIGCLFVVGGVFVGYVHAEPSVYPTGVTLYNPSKAYGTYVLFGALNGKSYLIDMDGNEVHTWPYVGFPTMLLDPKLVHGEKGHVLVHLDKLIGDKLIAELDWNGHIVWKWGENAPQGGAYQDQDWVRLKNGDTLLLCTYDHVIPEFSRKPIADQAIYEVTPAGKIVWRWVTGDHINEFGISPAGMRILHRTLANGFPGMGFLTINDMKVLGPNKWADAGDKRFNPNNIIISSREASFVVIIDKKTGHIVWRLGPNFSDTWGTAKGAHTASPFRFMEPQFSDTVPRPFDRMSGQHDAHLIPEGLPGAGDLLLFDNEGPSGFPTIRLSHHVGSRVLEINPVKKEIVWQYTAENSGQGDWTFYSSFLGSARRLPNGNTLIDEGMNGRIFQVTPQGEVVWEYVNPHFGPAIVTRKKDVQSNWVYRAQPVPYDWVPAGTPHSEIPVTPPALGDFHVPRHRP